MGLYEREVSISINGTISFRLGKLERKINLFGM